VMAQQIALVVHSDRTDTTSTGEAVVKSTTTTKTPAVKKEKTTPLNLAKGSVEVLVQHRGTMGHYRCLLGGFSQIAERVVAGIVSGEEVGMRGRGKVVWDVCPWEEGY
jgi:hypothetical protein